ncbi:MAG: Phenylpropionate dioxygenase, large terminal subunit [Ilumatobacteraceae bacterium]|nr:Phenylpropionate dioxygenase, large terminal subunit [Ilumatobacteraceae bacterium]
MSTTELPVGLPMPRRPELLAPGAPRLRVRTVTDRFPFPIPNGWFAIARSGELAPGEIRAMHLFGQDLVAFAGEDGAVHLTEAYCPHLGAHLAVGGRVDRDCITCPFHGWTFDGTSGACTDIPYAQTERIPARATLRTFPVVERNGLVFAWHHLDAGDPFFEVPVVPEFSSPDWLPLIMKEFFIATSCQDMAENNHDHAHFKFVHGTAAIPEGDELIDGTYKRVVTPELARETFGLGLGVVRRPGIVTFLSSVTPIDEDNVHIRWIFTAPVSLGEQVLAEIAEQFTLGVSQDIPIWENKVYRPRPVLTKGEAGIVAHRNWSAQFYSRPVEILEH